MSKTAFDNWYQPWQDKMRNEKVLTTFRDLRNEIEKQGKLETSLTAHIEYLNSNDLQPLLENPPPFSNGFFIGDRHGGSGWEIDYGDGVTEKIYVELPKEVKMTIDFEINELTNLENDMTTLEMLEYYYNYLNNIYIDARNTFT